MAVIYVKPEDISEGDWVGLTDRNTRAALWMPSQQWFQPIELKCDEDVRRELPPVFWEHVKKWREVFEKERADFTPEWHVKSPDIRFVYGKDFYQWGPELFGASNEEYECLLAGRIEKDLRELGCTYVEYTGMPD